MPVPPPRRITSRQHDVVRRCQRLARQGDPECVLLDGEHLIADAIAASVPIEIVLFDGRAIVLAGRARAAGAVVLEGTAAVLAAASPVRTTTGIVAIARWRPAPLADALAGDRPFVLGLAGVQDPGNAGSAIRAADALGATGVLTLDDTAQPGHWKTLRGAMGSTFHLPVARGTTVEAMAEARRRGLQIVATVSANGASVSASDLTRPSLLLLGSEGAGLPDTVVEAADQRLTIPMRARANSLNVAAAAAVILFEARRQRGAR